MKRARSLIQADFVHQKGILGKGITSAILDTGITPEHPDFSGRITGFLDFTKETVPPSRTLLPASHAFDDNGHGTHVAGILAGDGTLSNGIYRGLAPKSSILSLKVLDNEGNGAVEDLYQAIDWILYWKDTFSIRIANISVGTLLSQYMNENSRLVKSVELLWDAGIVVLTAAGNNGPGPQTIGAPGISRKIITIGSSDSTRSVELFGQRIRDYSGRGPTLSCIKKPDIVAPGSQITSCNFIHPACRTLYKIPGSPVKNGLVSPYNIKNGTSMSTPMVAGSIALLLSEKPFLSPKDVKLALKNSADDLSLPHARQGWGRLNVNRLLSL